MSEFDWHDAKFVLATLRAGSALAASRDLKTSQPTVVRRTAAFEEALGVTLFERGRTGVQPTEQAEALRPHLEALEVAARNLEAAARAETRHVKGVVRVTTNEVFANFALPAALREFQALYPDVRVEVNATDRYLDLGAGEADIAIRGGDAPTDAGLVARRISREPAVIFGSPEYLARHGRPRTLAELDGHTFLTCEGPYEAVERYLIAKGGKVTFSYRTSSPTSMIANARHGLGLVCAPPSFFLDDPELVPCMILPELEGSAWLITHERLRNAPRVRAFLDFFHHYSAGLMSESRRRGYGLGPTETRSAD